MWACARLHGECVYLCVRYDSNYGCPEPQRMDWEKPVMLHTLTHSCSCYTLVTATNSIGYRGERCLSWKQTQSEFLCFIIAEHSCHRQKKKQTEHVTLQTNQKKKHVKILKFNILCQTWQVFLHDTGHLWVASGNHCSYAVRPCVRYSVWHKWCRGVTVTVTLSLTLSLFVSLSLASCWEKTHFKHHLQKLSMFSKEPRSKLS